MSKPLTIYIIAEGKTESIFIKTVLAPYLANKNIYLIPCVISNGGGDVKFARLRKDANAILRKRTDVYVSTFVDYYGLKDMPGLVQARQCQTPQQIADAINSQTKQAMMGISSDLRVAERFISYIAVHEFESLLFSDSNLLANYINCPVEEIDKVLQQFNHQPEAINNNSATAPSKRLQSMSVQFRNRSYGKTTTGIEIAKKIGVNKMREKCLLFDNWLTKLESLPPL